MRKLKISMILIALLISSTSYGQEKPFKAVQDLFAAMSVVNHAKMKALVTDDFQLLEVGEDWDMDALIKVINPSEDKRRNYFSVIRTEIRGDMAWVSYWNKATLTYGDEIKVVTWLESAVMVKENSYWKVQLLHSTRIETDKIPNDIKLIEYIN